MARLTRRSCFTFVALAALLVTLLAPALPVGAAGPTATLAPAVGPVGTLVTLRGSGWPAGRSVTVAFGRSDQRLDLWLLEWTRGKVGADGTLLLSAMAPRLYTSLGAGEVRVTPGDYNVVIATATGEAGPSLSLGLTFTVLATAPPQPPSISWRFRDYYYSHDGGRLLGSPLSDVRFEGDLRTQYFEKGRLEDHQGEASEAGGGRFLYGLLGAQLVAAAPALPVGGETSTVTYATLQAAAAPEMRLPPPPGWESVAQTTENAAVFVPTDTALRPAPGHLVPARFWDYLNQPALFPGGWLHDVGLPLTEAMPAQVTKRINGVLTNRTITLQLFERTVLTDDLTNPVSFQVERANLGRDYATIDRSVVIPGDVVLHPSFAWIGPVSLDTQLPEGMTAPVWSWQSHYNTALDMEDEIAFLQAQLDLEGWAVQPGPVGGFASGGLTAYKGQRMQVITWWLGTRPGFPPDQPELGTQMRVVVGLRA